MPIPPLGGAPWNKQPEKWNLSETYKILRDSPWSPAKVTIETNYTQRHTDPLTGIVSESPLYSNKTGLVRGIEVSRSKPLPSVSVLWWSSKTIRLAEQRLAQLRARSPASVALRAEDLPDYVLAIEGEEPMRILRGASEDLHDTVFLELDTGLTLDFASVKFVEASDAEDARTEFHFARQKNGEPMIDINAERVIFHCRATAKTPLEGRENVIAVRVDFSPKAMRVRNTPDL
jgi:hypothetical protein